MPYALITGLLIITRLKELPISTFLKSFQIVLDNIFGTELSASLSPFYNPGFIFIVVCMVMMLIYRLPISKSFAIIRESLGSMKSTVIALCTAVSMVSIFINSIYNTAGLQSMPVELATTLSAQLGKLTIIAAC